MYKIGIFGSGGWGTALTIPLAHNGHQVRLWSFEKETAEEINHRHTNSSFLEGIRIPNQVSACNDFADMYDMDLYVLAVPTQFIRSISQELTAIINGKPVVNVAKGIERGSLLRVSGILEQSSGIAPDHYAILTGPSHAEEVGRNLPTTVVAASAKKKLSREVQKVFSTPFFRVYSSDDVTGCELGGAVKNVIAIAAGIIDGLGMGDNTKAALITRGLAEMSRLGVALGANPMTYSGLSGLGDLIVTCDSRHSRNRKVGELIGRGEKPADIMTDTKMVAEGIFTTESAYYLARQTNIEMPIVEQVYNIIFNDMDPMKAIKELMTRSSKSEHW
jgi:glycerol-3-phosphate dehydrogenase (NAD(P)+)